MVIIANKNYNCPQCGAPIALKSVNTKITSCEHCSSMLSVKEEELEYLGVKSTVLKDTSTIKIGTEGEYNSKHFIVIGRIQVGYEYGFWNEWYIQFDNGINGWMTDTDNGSYFSIEVLEQNKETIANVFGINVNKESDINLPKWNYLKAGELYQIYGRSFLAVDITENKIVGVEGEISRENKVGDDRKAVDLRYGKGFVTADYTNNETVIYIGKYSTEDLKLSNLKTPEEAFNETGYKASEMRAVTCPNCGDTRQKALPNVDKIICCSCSSEITLSTGLIKELKQDKYGSTRFNLYTTLSYKNKEWNVTGILKRTGSQYSWVDYFLTNKDNINETKWLSENLDYNSFFLSKKTNFVPSFNENSIIFENNTYGINSCEKYDGETIYVAGTFNWEVRLGDIVEINEYEIKEDFSYLVEEITIEKNENTKRHEEVVFTYTEKVNLSKTGDEEYKIIDITDATENGLGVKNGPYTFYLNAGKIFFYVLIVSIAFIGITSSVLLGVVIAATLLFTGMFDGDKEDNPEGLTLYRLLTVSGLGVLVLLSIYLLPKVTYDGNSTHGSSYGGGSGYSSSGSYSGGGHK